jgi:hypothetical protein
MLKKEKIQKNLIAIILIIIATLQVIETTQSFGTIVAILSKIIKYFAFPFFSFFLGSFFKDTHKEEYKKYNKKCLLSLITIQIIIVLYFIFNNGIYVESYLFSNYLFSWVFLAIPIYLLILNYLGKKIYTVFLGILVSLLVTFDNTFATNSMFYCIVAYFPFFTLGWNIEKIKEKITVKILIGLIFGFVISSYIGFKYLDNFVLTDCFNTDGYFAAFILSKICLYAIPSFAILIYSKLEKFMDIIFYNN